MSNPPLPTPPPHLAGGRLEGDPATFMPDVWEYFIKKFYIKTVIDVGCADGFNTRWFLERGCEVKGIEGWDELVKRSLLPEYLLVHHDYSTGPYVPGLYDLCWSSEFVEHVDEQFVPNFLATFKMCRYVCMTHAIPNQHGDHHVNCQTTEYWVRVMEEAGFSFDSRETKRLRLTDKKEFSYGRSTLMWFYNPRAIALG